MTEGRGEPAVDSCGPAPEAPAGASAAARRLPRLVLWVPAVIVGLDQATKAMVRAWLPLHATREIVPGFLNLTRVENTGAAFGLLNSVEFPFKAPLLALVAAAALVGIAVYAASVAAHQWLARAGLGLIVGGAVGNLIDRLTAGYVIDFVDVYWRQYHFWAFNVADSAITVGVGLMLLEMLGLRSHAPQAD